LKLTPSVLEIDYSEAKNRICRFIREYVENAGVKGIVLGLSGGIDSATIAGLSSLAIGGNNVLGLMLPEEENFDQKDIDDANAIAKIFKLQTQICDMSKVLDCFYKAIPAFDVEDKLCKGNIKARTRMVYL
jgi:NAD+ synthase